MGTMLDCGPTTRELVARLTTPTRNRYYYGKLLDTYHLELEQRYGISKRWMLNRLALGAGVLCGLHVTVSADKRQVRVGSGVAIDGWGREIIVPSNSPGVDPTQPTDGCGKPAGDPVKTGTVSLYVCYHECEAEPSPALVSECDDRACENGLVREKYRLQIRAGFPNPPGSITDDQCTSIFGPLPPDMTRRIVACETLDPTCAAPDDACIPIATITLDPNGGVESVDECTYRTTVYSNATLLDLIFCLAERVDACCGGTVTKAIKIVSGEPQVGTAGQQLPMPLVTQVTEGGTNVANEAVTFDVTVGGGAIGDNAATLGPSFTVNTDANGVAVCPIWRAGPSGGTQQVTAHIASGAPSLVVFHATVTAAQVSPPIVRAVWPPPGVVLSVSAPQPVLSWMIAWRERQRIQITFDRKMRDPDLANVQQWLRLVAIYRPDATTFVPPTTAYPVALKYSGPAASPFLPAAGVCEEFDFPKPNNIPLLGVRFALMMSATSSEIMSNEPTPILLDGDFAGTSLTAVQIAQLWSIAAPTTVDPAILAALTGTGAPLPSGNGTPGGFFHSTFAVAAQ